MTTMRELLLAVLFLGPLIGPLQTPGGVVTGQLASTDGRPAQGVRVGAMVVPDSNLPVSNATTLVSFVLTDAAGRYRLENVPPGRYYVTAGLVETPTYYPGVSSTNGATVVNVTANSTVANINFTLTVPPGVIVSGRVIRPPTLSGIQTVQLIGGTAAIQPATLKADGAFQFSNVRPGNYNLFVGGGQAQTTNIVVADKDISGVEVVIPLTVSVTGTLVVENGGLRPRFGLSFTPFKGGVNAPGTAMLTNGTFTTQVPEGEYRVTWSQIPAGYYMKAIASGSVDLLAGPLVVAAGTSVSPITVTLGVANPVPWVKVSGRVVNPLPTSTIPVRLTMIGGSALEPLDVAINPDGSFEFPRVLPGSYTARITPAMPIPPIPLFVTNKDLTGVEVAIPAMKEITGHVVVEGLGQLAPRLNFILADSRNSSSASAIGFGMPDGSFGVTLPEGDRRLTLNVPGYTVKSLTYGTVDVLRNPLLKIAGTDSAEFNVVLSPTAAVTGIGVGVPGGVLGGVLGGVVGGVPGGVPGSTLIANAQAPPTVVNNIVPVIGLTSPPPPPPPPPPASGAQSPLRLGGSVAQGNLIYSPPPTYPEAARAAQVSGVVILNATISPEGSVESLSVASGNALLNQAAMDAVKQWRYKPTISNGQAVRIQTTITVNFSLK